MNIHTIIRTFIWTSIVIVSMLLVDWFSRAVIMELPW